MMRVVVPVTVALAACFVAAPASAEETTLKPITVVGRPARPSVVIEIKRETPNIGLRPLTPPKSFMGNQ